MVKPTTRPVMSGDASAFARPGGKPDGPRCHWLGCYSPQFAGLPVCPFHAIRIHGFMRDLLGDGVFPAPPKPKAEPTGQPYVYYLMLSPTTVKIGTTRSLTQRLNALRSEAQYVVAIECGGRDLEHQRHQEFAEERRNSRREDFHLSDRLKRHIDELAPYRDELVKLAIAY